MEGFNSEKYILGDKDLVSFLQEEISYEQDNLSEIPKFKDFKV